MSQAQKPPLDCYEGDPDLLPPDEAWRRIAASVSPVADEATVSLQDALGLILAAPVRSPANVPGHTNSAVDGYAVDGASLPLDEPMAFEVLGTAWAGAPFEHAVAHGAAARIMTGAAMPDGTDSVVMQEHVDVTGEMVMIGTGHRRGQNVRQAGEDLKAGQTVLETGKRLGPAEIGMLASLGFAEVPVRRRLRVAVLSTGDELRQAGQTSTRAPSTTAIASPSARCWNGSASRSSISASRAMASMR